MRVKFISEMDKFLKKAREASNKMLGQLGGYARKVAQQSIKIDALPSRAGSPPHSRKGQLKRAILYAVDPQKQNVVIGPTSNVVGPAGEPHEFGGEFRGQHYPKRPFIGPAVEVAERSLDKLWADSVK